MTRGAGLALPVVLLLVATALRGYEIGRASFWYDEVVTMNVARSSGPLALVRTLDALDATRAPLHPLLLQGWLALFGTSEAAARSLSAVCGVLTVLAVYRLGRRLDPDPAVASWATMLATVSPLLVYYAREARMYAWLVLVTCLAWDALLALRNGTDNSGETTHKFHGLVYVVLLAALGYSHPLGLLMAATLALASLVHRRALGWSWGGWLGVHIAAGVLLAPWLPRYFDHPPEYTIGRLPWKFLLGTPIGFFGGNFPALGLLGLVIAFGLLLRTPRGWRLADPVGSTWLLLWVIVPPTVLYGYSLVGHPIFGPNRYTLYVAPAFFLLLARGLVRLPAWGRWPVGLGTVALSLAALPGMVYVPGLKADWRAAAARLDALDPDRDEPVVVATSEPGPNHEVETARYYVGPSRAVFPTRDALPAETERAWFAVGLRDGKPIAAPPKGVGDAPSGPTIEVDGLRLVPRAVTEDSR